MRNYVQTGNVLTLPAPYALASGSGAKVGAIFGVAAETVGSGAPVDLAVEGVFNLAKVAASAMSVGDPVFWDDTAKLVTGTGTNNTRIGVVVTAAANPSGTVDVRLNGSF